jgi:hypothetical protein
MMEQVLSGDPLRSPSPGGTGGGVQRRGTGPEAGVDASHPAETALAPAHARPTAVAAPVPRAPWYRRAGAAWVRAWRLAAGSLGTAVGYVAADNAKHKRSLTIGVTTVFLVVCFLGYALSPRMHDLHT